MMYNFFIKTKRAISYLHRTLSVYRTLRWIYCQNQHIVSNGCSATTDQPDSDEIIYLLDESTTFLGFVFTLGEIIVGFVIEDENSSGSTDTDLGMSDPIFFQFVVVIVK